MGLFGNDNNVSGGMNVSQTGAPMMGMQPQMSMQPQSQMNGMGMYQPQQQNGFMGAMMGGMGTPPSETEILIQLLNSGVPVEKWLAGPNFQNVVSMLSNLMTLSIHNYFKDAKFTADEDGNLTIDVSSLPSDVQTTSVENVTMELQKVQSSAQQSVQMTQMQQQQIAAMAQQSMMQSALGAAMADPSMVSKAGGAVGGFARSLIGLPPSTGGM